MAFEKHRSTLVMHVLSSTCGAGGKSDNISGKMLSPMACPKQLGMSTGPAEHSPASDLGWLGVSMGKAPPSPSVSKGLNSALLPLFALLREQSVNQPWSHLNHKLKGRAFIPASTTAP